MRGRTAVARISIGCVVAGDVALYRRVAAAANRSDGSIGGRRVGI
jgi:hypothetical protein